MNEKTTNSQTRLGAMRSSCFNCELDETELMWQLIYTIVDYTSDCLATVSSVAGFSAIKLSGEGALGSLAG